MSKRSIYTIVTPLPPTISRQTAVSVLHNHVEMIELNPLVIKHVKTRPPPNAPADEFHCTWYELTDRITYLPGIKGKVSYKACFHDMARSIQTHVYAPAGLEIKEKWSIGGNEPGEEREQLEIGMAGLGVPRDGLYLREDVDMRCNLFLTTFVKKTLRKAHQVLVERLVVKADLEDDKKVRQTYQRNPLSPSSSVHLPTSPISVSLRDNPMPPLNQTTLNRGASVRSDGASSDVTSTTLAMSEMPGQYIAELPVGLGLKQMNSVKNKDQDPTTLWVSQRKFDSVQEHPTHHPSNAFGIPPPEPIELEAHTAQPQATA